MTRIERTKADSVEEMDKGGGLDRHVVENPEDFKGAAKGKRDRASQLVQRYGKHST